MFMTQLSAEAAARLADGVARRPGKPAATAPGMTDRARIGSAYEIRDWCRSTWAALDRRLEKFIDAALDGPQEEERLIRVLVALEMMRDQLGEYEKLVAEREGVICEADANDVGEPHPRPVDVPQQRGQGGERRRGR
jgi:hypothetical protein